MTRLSNYLPTQYITEAKFMLWLVIFMACQTAIRIAYAKGFLACSTSPEYLLAINGVVEYHGNALEGLNSIRSCLVGGLLICAAGIYLQRWLSMLLSFLAIFFLGGIFICWYVASLADLRELEVVRFSQLQGANGQHLIPLRFATWWDILVLIPVVTLFLWHLRILSVFVAKKLK